MLAQLARGFVREHGGYFAGYVLLALAAAVGTIGAAVLVDRVVQGMDVRLIAALGCLALFNEGMAVAQGALDRILLPKLRGEVARAVVQALLERSRRNFHPLVLSQALTALSTVPFVLAELAEQTREIFLPIAVIVPACLAFLWWTMPLLGLTATVAIALALALLGVGTLASQARHGDITVALLTTQENTEDVLRNVENILALDTEALEARRAVALFNASTPLLHRAFWTDSVAKTCVALTGGVLLLVVLGWAVFAEEHPMRLAIIMISLYVVQRLTQATAHLRSLSTALAWLQRVDDLLDLASRPEPVSQPAPTGQVVLEDVAFSYNQTASVFQHLSWTLQPGQHAHLRGANGSGKSTLLRLMRGHLRPNSGRVLLDNIPLSDYPQDELAKSVLYIPQHPILFRRTVRENITYGAENPPFDVRALWTAYGLPAAFLDPDAEGELSGGQRQVVYLLRLLLTATDRHVLVLLDEPAASIDPTTAVAVWSMVGDLTRGRTAVLVSHTSSNFPDVDISALQ